jgi:hypothetical protein
VIVGSRKPLFFTDGPQLFEIDLPTGLLHNTDNGSPLVQLDCAQTAKAPSGPVPETLRRTAALASDGTSPLAHVRNPPPLHDDTAQGGHQLHRAVSDANNNW